MHVEGCRDALANHARNSLFLSLCIFTSCIFLLQLVIAVLLRYLQTSIELAARKGDPTADSLAYILSICLPYDDMTDDRSVYIYANIVIRVGILICEKINPILFFQSEEYLYWQLQMPTTI